MQAFGLSRRVTRGAAPASRLLAAERSEAARKRDIPERWRGARAHGLSAGMERRQAEAVAHAVASLGAAGRDDLATKADPEQLRTATKADLEKFQASAKTDMEQLRTATEVGLEHLRTDLERLRATAKADLKAGLSTLEARVTWRLVVAAGVIVAAVKLIPGP